LLKCLMWRRWYQSANLPVLVLFRIQTPYNQRSSYTSIDSLEDKIVYDVYQNSLTNIIIFTLSDRSFKFNRLCKLFSRWFTFVVWNIFFQMKIHLITFIG
jgi:hypothetical protein